MYNKFYYLLSKIPTCFSANSQQLATISGKITDTKSNALSYSAVTILNTNRAILSGVGILLKMIIPWPFLLLDTL